MTLRYEFRRIFDTHLALPVDKIISGNYEDLFLGIPEKPRVALMARMNSIRLFIFELAESKMPRRS